MPNRSGKYLARTVLHLPFIEKTVRPGEIITSKDLEDAKQTSEDVTLLLEGGAISDDLEAGIDPAHEPVKPGAPSIHSIVSQAQSLVEEMEARGEKVPKELKAAASLDVQHVIGSQTGAGNDGA